MSDCLFCGIVDGSQSVSKIYEDEKVIAYNAPEPAALGHMIVIPKKHYPILELVPDFLVGHIFYVANKLSVAVFESLGVQGTNIIVQNGNSAGQVVPHVSVHIIPRIENDSMNFDWQPKQLGEEEMSTVELSLKENTKDIGNFEYEETKLEVEVESNDSDKPKDKVDEKIDDVKEKRHNYLLKQLERIP